MTTARKGLIRSGSRHILAPPAAWPAILVALVVAALAGRSAADAVQPPDIGELAVCADARPQLVIAVFDVSSSVIDSGGADPSGRSFTEAIQLADLLQHLPCTADDRFAGVIFADQSVEIPPILVSSHSVIEAVVKRPPDGEIGRGTQIGLALVRVEEMIRRYPEHAPTILILSDMQTEESLHDPLGAIATHPLHLIALGQHDPTYDDAFDTVVELDRADKGTVGSIMVDLINAGRTS